MNKYDEAKTCIYDALFILCDGDEELYDDTISLPTLPHSEIEKDLLNIAARLANMSDIYNKERFDKEFYI